MPHIIVKAMLLVRNGLPAAPGEAQAGDKLLFSRGYDAVKKEAFLRPLGGHVEFGERGEETILREMKEELGCEALGVRFISMIENLFTYNGEQGHEIVLVYEGKLSDESFYKKDSFTFMEGERKTEAGWFSKSDAEKEGIPIYPPFAYFTLNYETRPSPPFQGGELKRGSE